MTTIACMSDIHNRQGKFICPPADILVVAGDLTSMGEGHEIRNFGKWLAETPYRYKIVVAGNHDWGFQRNDVRSREFLGDGKNGVIYLRDSGVTIADPDITNHAIKFWGSPWQPEFCGWAFNVDHDTVAGYEEWARGRSATMAPPPITLEDYWAGIPDDTNVLITHGPAAGMLDECPDGRKVGSRSLWDRIMKVRPKLHVCGHIHHSRGIVHFDGITFVNAAICDELYRPVNPVQVIEL